MKRKLRGLLSVLTSVVLLLGLGFSVSADNEMNNAKPVTFGETYRGVLGDECSQFFQFNLQESSKVIFSIEDEVKYAELTLYNSDGNRIDYQGGSCNDLGLFKTSYSYDLTSGKYYCKLWNTSYGRSGYTGNYSINFKAVSANESFKETGKGNNNDAKTANTIELGKSYKGQIAYNDSVDYYRFTLKESSQLFLSGESNFRINVNLYDADGSHWYDFYYNKNDLGNVIINDTTMNLIAGTYVIKIDSSYSETGYYSFKLDSKAVGESFAETIGKTNNSTSSASAIDLNNQTYVGQIAANDKVDFYKLSVSDYIDFDIYFEGIELDCTLYDDQGNSIKAYRIRDNARSLESYLSSGTYYLKVETHQYNGVYKFTGCAHNYQMTTYKASPYRNGSVTSECTKCGKQGWSSTIYAPSSISLSKSYYVYNGSYFQPSVTVYDSNSNVISNSHYSVVYGDNKNIGKGYVKVIFSSGEYEGEMYANFYINPKKMSLKKAKSVKKKVKATWKKKSGASGYELQIGRRMYSNYSGYYYTNLKTIAVSKKKTSRTIKSVKKHITYGVRIRYYKTVNGVKYYSDYSNWKNVYVK